MNEIYPTPKTQVIIETIDKSIRLAKQRLEKEKDVMCEFAVKCMDGIEYGLLQSEVKTYYNETFVSNVSELVCTQCGGKKDIKFSAMKNFMAYCEDCRDE